MSKRGWIGVVLGLVVAPVLLPAAVQKSPAPVDNVMIEIYRIAQGQHEALL